ncbi:DNA-processing protein DprA [Streptomyces sp. NPDC008079]|uniref:DNA-processing protein DprA n=1 Tax=Streptomyces sp. NPDC008079 TaxID=3364806 RepID=UPI0036E1C3F9
MRRRRGSPGPDGAGPPGEETATGSAAEVGAGRVRGSQAADGSQVGAAAGGAGPPTLAVPALAVPALAAAVPEAERLARVAITRIADPGDEVVGRALRERGAEEVLRALREGEALPGAGPRRTDGYRTRSVRADPEGDLEAARRAGGRFVCPEDADWPGQLDDLGPQRPYGLWVRGQPSLRLWALRSVAVVGARACTDYGAHMAARLGGGLARAGWVVVSGAAYGVDGVVHRGALRAGGATIGVVASGVDVPYPPGNAQLIGEIAERGLLVGELPPGDHPTRSRFVLRNRVIAALTRGTVVVEARYRSGSLVTARRAAQLGRVTMGVPGPCTSGLSEGVHELLRGDAVVVTDAAEVIEMVGEIGADLAPARRGPVLPRDLLDPAAARVLEALPGQGDAREEEIALAVGSTSDDTLRRLYELQALGFVERDDGRWKLVRTAHDGAPRREG